MTKREIKRRNARLDKMIVELAVNALNVKHELEAFMRDIQIARFKATRPRGAV